MQQSRDESRVASPQKLHNFTDFEFFLKIERCWVSVHNVNPLLQGVVAFPAVSPAWFVCIAENAVFDFRQSKLVVQ